jgi:hypothetical protein
MGMVAGFILLICGAVGGFVGGVVGAVLGLVVETAGMAIGRSKINVNQIVCPACNGKFLNHSEDGWPQCPHCQSFYRIKNTLNSGWKLIFLSCLTAGCIGGIGYGYFFHVAELFNNMNKG